MGSIDSSNLERLMSVWQQEPGIASNIVHWKTDPENSAILVDYPQSLAFELKAALHNLGINQLFSHQNESFQAIQDGKNVVIVTGTASGKTLCYNLPILNAYLQSPQSCALYLFPTKALTQDQQSSLTGLIDAIPENNNRPTDKKTAKTAVAVYDGDTPSSYRTQIRSRARLLMTNPDMLHIAMLPHHTIWAEFFRNLHYVVIDEIHTYRGIFGSHIANVIRRLKRVTAFYNAYPQFILTSATIANPQQLAERLIEEPVMLVDNDGSPHGTRHFLLYNPPVVQEELGIRRSPVSEAVQLASDLLAYQVQTIIFSRTRRTVEMILKYLRDQSLSNAENLHGYRSGYLPRERRAIEHGLRSGATRAVVATTALELGVDIGSMEAAILVGYPGTIASTRQQAGRSGRRQGPSMAILIASSSPLDQFLMKHTEYLFSRSPEQALIDPDNLLILLNHLRCAAFELPFNKKDRYGNVSIELLSSLLNFLEENNAIHESGEKYYWMADEYPANAISLRSSSGNTILLQAETEDGRITIGEVDQASAYWMVHPHAIYLHEGQSYQVNELDLENHVARLAPVAVDYFTESQSHIEIEKLSISKQAEITGGEKFYGEIMVNSQVVGYRVVNWATREVLGEYPLDMPVTQLRTMAYWFCLQPGAVDQLRSMGLWKSDPNNYGPNWNVQRNLARRRDNYTCQVCGIQETDQAHHVHHKVPFRTFSSYQIANQLDNLITLCPNCHQRAETVIRMRSGLAGLSYVLHHLAPLFLMCDVGDLGVLADPQSKLSEGRPTVVIYDQIQAGIGLSEALYRGDRDLLNNAFELISTCDCQDGCPSCVGPSGENGVGGKQETLALLSILLDRAFIVE